MVCDILGRKGARREWKERQFTRAGDGGSITHAIAAVASGTRHRSTADVDNTARVIVGNGADYTYTPRL
jgi:hypothetical protein